MHELTTAMRALERAAAGNTTAPGWRGLLTNRLKALRGAYIGYLETSMGGTNAAVEDNPWLHPRLIRLRRDQATVADDIDRLVEASSRESPASIRQHVGETLVRLHRVREREVNLLYESIDMDLGGEQ